MKVILATQSSRKIALMQLAQIECEIVPSNFDEKANKNFDIEEKSKELAYGKALDVFNNTQGNRAIIGADTFVVKNNKIYEKPTSRADAIRMIRELQGGVNTIYTSTAILIEDKGEYKEFKELKKIDITISPMTDAEIIEYVDFEEPLDRAGAYSVQSSFAKFIENVDGDYMAAIGLPINYVYKTLKENEVF